MPSDNFEKILKELWYIKIVNSVIEQKKDKRESVRESICALAYEINVCSYGK